MTNSTLRTLFFNAKANAVQKPCHLRPLVQNNARILPKTQRRSASSPQKKGSIDKTYPDRAVSRQTLPQLEKTAHPCNNAKGGGRSAPKFPLKFGERFADVTRMIDGFFRFFDAIDEIVQLVLASLSTLSLNDRRALPCTDCRRLGLSP